MKCDATRPLRSYRSAWVEVLAAGDEDILCSSISLHYKVIMKFSDSGHNVNYSGRSSYEEVVRLLSRV